MMNGLDILLIAAVAAGVAAAVHKMHKAPGCHGDCKGCSQSCAYKEEEQSHETEQ